MVLVAKGELLLTKLISCSYFLHDSEKVNHLFCSRIDLKIINFIEVWRMGTKKILVDILEQLQWNHEYHLGKVGWIFCNTKTNNFVLRYSRCHHCHIQLHLNQYCGKGVE